MGEKAGEGAHLTFILSISGLSMGLHSKTATKNGKLQKPVILGKSAKIKWPRSADRSEFLAKS
jgi:hypothetical protein